MYNQVSTYDDLVATNEKSCDQLQLGWVQVKVMIPMHFIHPWADRQL